MLRAIAAAAACTLYFICGQDALRAQPVTPPRAGAESAQLIGVTLMPSGGRPHLAVGVGNRTDDLLWLRITVEAGTTVVCEGERVPLAGMEIDWFLCPMDAIVQGRVYPVRVEVFRTRADLQPVMAKEAKPVFSVRDVSWLNAQLKP